MYSNFASKWLYIACITLFEVGSAICGAAPSMDVFIFGRAICGAGGAGMYTGCMTLISFNTTETERAFYLGIPGLTWGIATVLGPIVGGAFTISSVGWRFAFYINLFIGAAFAPITIWLVPSKDPRPGTSVGERLKNVDFLGLVLLIGVILSGLMGIAAGGSLYAWNSGSIIACFVVSVILIVVLLAQQTFCIGVSKETRSIPLAFFRNTTLMIIWLNETCSATAIFVTIYFLPLYFQFVRGDSALMAGVRLLPLVCFLVAAIIFNGYIVTRTGKYSPWFFFGGTLVLAGGALMFTITTSTTNAAIYGFSILIGCGSGVYLQLPFAAAQTEVEPSLIPVAVGFISFAQLGAPALMLSVANAIFLNTTTARLLKLLPEFDLKIITRIISGVGENYLTSLDAETRSQAVTTIIEGMSYSYILVFASGAITLVISCFFVLNYMRGKRFKA